MAISPKKLGAYMEAQNPDLDEVEIEEDELEAEGEEVEADESAEHEELEEFMEMVMDNGTLLETAAHQVELFGDEAELDDDTIEQIQAALESLPDALKTGMAKYFAGLSIDELHELVEQLEEMEAIENDAVVVPFLFHASKLLAQA